MNDALHKTLADAVDFLQARGLPFAVIGGIAVAVRGEPRFTADVDAVVSANVDRALALVEELDGSLFRALFPDVGELVQTAFLLPLRHVQTHIKLDLAIGLSGFEQQVIARATAVHIADRAVPIASSEDLILMKLLAARPRDIEDAQGIVARQRALDWQYVRQLGKDLQEALGVNLMAQIADLERS